MVSVLLFGIIILIAIISFGWYYLSGGRSKRPAGERSITSIDSKPTAQSAVAAGQPPRAAHHGQYVRDQFLPEEAGIYHQAERLSETRWADLEHSLAEMSRLPTDVAELLDVLHNPESSASHVAEICERNVGLTARVLKLVNSPFFSPVSPVYDVRHAVALLGFNQIRQLVVTASLFQRAKDFEGPIVIDDLWKHSLATARLTYWLYDRLDLACDKGLAGTGAMLHDIGKVVLQHWRPEALRLAISVSREQGKSLLAAELEELGLTHALAGALLFKRWNLPSDLVSVVKGCHLPIVSTEMPEAGLIHLSGQVARVLAIGADSEPPDESIPADLRLVLGIESDSLPALLDWEFQEFVSRALADVRVDSIASPS